MRLCLPCARCAMLCCPKCAPVFYIAPWYSTRNETLASMVCHAALPEMRLWLPWCAMLFLPKCGCGFYGAPYPSVRNAPCSSARNAPLSSMVRHALLCQNANVFHGVPRTSVQNAPLSSMAPHARLCKMRLRLCLEWCAMLFCAKCASVFHDAKCSSAQNAPCSSVRNGEGHITLVTCPTIFLMMDQGAFHTEEHGSMAHHRCQRPVLHRRA